ncbi:MAG: hypothetical protein ACJAX4_000808 [Clostridium sp.]|jgi:hypothetical protein
MNILYIKNISHYLREVEGSNNDLFVLSQNTRKMKEFK